MVENFRYLSPPPVVHYIIYEWTRTVIKLVVFVIWLTVSPPESNYLSVGEKQ